MRALKRNLKDETFWLRLIFMLLFLLIVEIALFVLFVLVIWQFVYRLFVGNSYNDLLHWSNSLTQFVYQIYRFLTYQTDVKPFPFHDWPTPKDMPD